MQFQNLNVVCLAGGVGGAKLADGLAQVVPPDHLTIIVNTGDDFQHLGLAICPDLDTVMYTLGGLANQETGWGRTGESWRTIGEIGRFSGPDWFRLGDLDLATHLVRTHLLQEGLSLTAVTQHLCRQLDIQPDVLPMCDQPAPTLIETQTETLPFQVWFVKEKWQPTVKKVHLPQDARATPRVMRKLEEADVLIIAPSNPFVSIDPILNVYPIREMVADMPQVVLAVSPIVGGQAVKGPAAKMMHEMKLPATPQAVAEYYGELLTGFVYDSQDAGVFGESDLPLLCVDTMMYNRADRVRLATDMMEFARKLIV